MSIYFCDRDFKKPQCVCDEPRHIDDNFYVNYFVKGHKVKEIHAHQNRTSLDLGKLADICF